MYYYLLGDEVDRYVLDAMLQSGREHTPILVANSVQNVTQTVYQPVVVANALKLCRLANHPWQVNVFSQISIVLCY